MSVDRYYGLLHKLDFIFYKTRPGRNFLDAIKIMHRFTEKVCKTKFCSSNGSKFYFDHYFFQIIDEEQEKRSETKIELNSDVPTHIYNSTGNFRVQ